MGRNFETLDKVLYVFYETPSFAYTVREISKITGIPKSTVQKYLDYLKKINLIGENNKPILSYSFKIRKAFYYIQKMQNIGLIDNLDKELVPSSIILFGSFQKGESDKDSDIDIFIESSKKKNLDLKKFEKKLGHSIQLFIENDINNLPDRLFNNVVNGIKLRGYFKVK